MACTWRIRHKLMLGMSLILAVMGLLLGGTLKGLASYRATMRAIDSKLENLLEADKVRDMVKTLLHPTMQAQVRYDRLELARNALKDYRANTSARQDGHAATDRDFREEGQLEALDKLTAELQDAIERDTNKATIASDMEQGDFEKLADKMLNTANDLLRAIHDGLVQRIDRSQKEARVTFAIVISTSVAAVVLMAGILAFFYRSVARPIRQLEQGAQRVAKGDFEHRLTLRSGDEMEDLASAFNNMTERLRDMYRDLARQVNERSRQLVRSERLAGVGFLAAGVAHEINNPLASIAFCGEALERRLADLFEARRGKVADPVDDAQEREIVSKYLKMIQEEAFRCKTITRKLLEFSRGGERRREPTDLGGIIQVVLDMVQHLPTYKGKEVIFDQDDKITAWVNGQEIQQVLLNLVVNALESMDEGGHLTISLTRSASADDPSHGLAELVFQDTGCGMTGEVLENIFEPFFTRSRTGKGTGLGLSISHRIISQHGGDIEATSAGPGQGSTFIVRLPVDPPVNQQETDMEVLDPETEFLKMSTAQRKAA